MAFLQALRGTGMFNRAKPLGMPDEEPNLSAVLREVSPLARSANDADLRRKKELMMFENTINRVPSVDQSSLARMVKAGSTFGQGKQPRMAPGPSTTQLPLRQRDETELNQRFKSGESKLDRENRLTAVMEEAKLRNEGENSRLAQELMTRREMNTADNTTRREVSQAELAARTKEAETERLFKTKEAAARDAADANQIRLRGEQDRQTWGMRPNPANNPSQQDDATNAAVQRLRIENPALYSALEFDTDSKTWGFKAGAPPEAIAGVQQYLKRPTAAPSATPNATGGQVMKRFSPSRNETQVSTDGGKTWKKQ